MGGKNALALNTEKTKMIVIGTPQRIRTIGNLNIMFNNVLIQQWDTFKCLGLTIDNTLRWDIHIEKMAKLCHFRICSLYKIRQFIPDKFKLVLGHTLVLSLVSYMSSIWSSATSNCLATFEKVIRSLARFISGKQRHDSVGPTICNELKWLFPKEFGCYNLLCIMFKLRNVLPIEFSDGYFVLNNLSHSYPTSTSVSGSLSYNYVPTTKYGYTTFHFRAIDLWNKLPNDLKQCSSLNVFKNKLKKNISSFRNVID